MRRVAVLGAGIMGSATALFLARRGTHVTLFDVANAPMAGASRTNEGKVHLGYLYAADPSLDTARRLLPGGLAFRPLVEDLIGTTIEPAVSMADDTYVVHRSSVVGVDDTARYYAAVTQLVSVHPAASQYLVPPMPSRAERLSARELEAEYDTASIVAGFRVPERSVSTEWIADRFVGALAAEPRVECRLGVRVRRVMPSAATLAGPLRVETCGGVEGPFDVVVNALWEGRLAVDADLGRPLPPAWSHRYRLSAFVRTVKPVSVPSAVVATGPFGDVKNYTGRDLYLSWYLTGLVAEGNGISAPTVPPIDDAARARLIDEIFERLGAIVAPVRALKSEVQSVRLAGGWVYAAGRGPLDDRRSTLHRRDRVGITRVGDYISIDTGKYSIAPWLAQQVADQITGA